MNIIEYDINKICKKPVIIYGASLGGKLVYQLLKKNDIEILGFCDSDVCKKTMLGLPVFLPESISKYNGVADVVIAGARSINTVIGTLKKNGCENVYVCEKSIDSVDVDISMFNDYEKTQIKVFLNQYPIYVSMLTQNGISRLPALEVFTTERCTLKCRDCSHLIHRYNNPQDHDVNQIIDDLKFILEIIDVLDEIIILGGEPFLYRSLKELLEWIGNQNKISTITIITNGTIVPSDDLFEVVYKYNVRIRMSNYGDYSKAINQLVSICSEIGIEYFISNEPWTDMGRLFDHNYSIDELKNMLNDCPYANSILLLNGHIFRCAHIAHINALNIFDSNYHDSYDISFYRSQSKKNARDAFEDLLGKNYFEGCRMCGGYHASARVIKPAIQIS